MGTHLRLKELLLLSELNPAAVCFSFFRRPTAKRTFFAYFFEAVIQLLSLSVASPFHIRPDKSGAFSKLDPISKKYVEFIIAGRKIYKKVSKK